MAECASAVFLEGNGAPFTSTPGPHSNRPFHTEKARHTVVSTETNPAEGILMGVTRDPQGGLWRPLDCSDGSDREPTTNPQRGERVQRNFKA